MAVELGFIVFFTSSKIRKDVSPDTFEESSISVESLYGCHKKMSWKLYRQTKPWKNGDKQTNWSKEKVRATNF